jgi:hypothetical protein
MSPSKPRRWHRQNPILLLRSWLEPAVTPAVAAPSTTIAYPDSHSESSLARTPYLWDVMDVSYAELAVDAPQSVKETQSDSSG